MIDKFTAAAGSLTIYRESGDFFRLLETTGKVTIYFYRQGREVARADEVGGGYAEKFSDPFDEIAIESLVIQSVQFAIRLGNVVSYDVPPKGVVSIDGYSQGIFTSAQRTVTNGAATLAAASPTRTYLLVQNKDLTGDIYVTFGQNASISNGVKIPPGGSFELTGRIPSNAMSAVGSLASNPNVVVMEGF